MKISIVDKAKSFVDVFLVLLKLYSVVEVLRVEYGVVCSKRGVSGLLIVSSRAHPATYVPLTYSF
jgi:hypothetical protein